MVQRAEQLLEDIRSKNESSRLNAIRKIKNQVIGNKRRKTTFIKLNAVKAIAELLSEDQTSCVRVQSALVLSSLSRIGTSGEALTDPSILAQLIKLLDSPDEIIVVNGLEALCRIFEEHGLPDGFPAFRRLESFLTSDTPNIVVLAARLFAILLAQGPSICGSYDGLLKLPNLVVDRILTGVSGNMIFTLLLAHNSLYFALPEREPMQPETCIAVAELIWRSEKPGFLPLVPMCEIGIAVLEGEFTVQKAPELGKLCLTTLLEWVKEVSSSGSTATVLHRFLSQNKQSASLIVDAVDSGAVILFTNRLRAALKSTARKSFKEELTLAGIFNLLTCLSEGSSIGRGQVVASLETLPDEAVNQMLDFPRNKSCHALRLAILQFLQMLSSVTVYVERLHKLFRPLISICMAALENTDFPEDFQERTCSLLANAVLDNPENRDQCLENGGVKRFVSYVRQHKPGVRRPGMRGLANLCYLAGPEQKQAVLKDLPVVLIYELYCEPDISVDTINLISNLLACPMAMKNNTYRDCANFIGIGWICEKLSSFGAYNQERGASSHRPHVLHVFVNLAVFGNAYDRDKIVESMLLTHLQADLSPESPATITAALEIVEDLASQQDTMNSWRVQQLAEKGVFASIEKLQQSQGLTLTIVEQVQRVMMLR